MQSFFSASFASGGEFAVALGEDLLALPQLVLGRDVADGAVQADGVVMSDKLGDAPLGVIQ